MRTNRLLDGAPSNEDASGMELASASTRPDPARFQASHSTRGSTEIEEASLLQVNPWSLAEAVSRRWYWLVLGAVAFGFVGFFGASTVWQTSYTATAQLIRHDSPLAVEAFRDRQTSMQTFADLFRAPDLVQRVAAAAQPPLSAESLASALTISPERNKETLIISVTAPSPERASELANLHAQASVQLTQQLQAEEARTLNRQLGQQLAGIEDQMRQIRDSVRRSAETVVPVDQSAPLPASGAEAPPLDPSVSATDPTGDSISGLRRSMLVEQMRTTQSELSGLLNQFTEASPLVKAQRIKLAVLESQFEDLEASIHARATSGIPAAAAARVKVEPGGARGPLPGALARSVDIDITRSQLASLESARLPLATRQGLFQNLVDTPPAQVRVLVPARPQDAIKNGRDIKVASVSTLAALMGVALAAMLVLLVEATARQVRTDDDLRRITRLPVIASLGNLRRMSQPIRDQWSFRAWTALQGRLDRGGSRGLVCGIISSSDGEGRSTLIQLLARAAGQRGYRVLIIDTCPEGSTNGSKGQEDENESSAPSGPTIVTANVLASPGEVADKLIGPNPHVIVHISLPDWSWNLERRKQLEMALDHWRALDDVVILVNLPAASKPQAIVLAEELSNVVWLADSGRADAAATRKQIETLRLGRCNLIGAVLNHAPSHPLKDLFPRWVPA